MTIADQRVNDLVNQLEAGKLSRSAFLRSLGEQGLLGHGIGGLVAKRPGAAAPAGQKDLVRTGVLLKISRRRGSDNRIQGKVKTNALDLEESFVDGFRELNVLGGSGKVQIGGKAVPLAPKAHIRVDHHQLINYKHGGPQPWEFEAVCHPTW